MDTDHPKRYPRAVSVAVSLTGVSNAAAAVGYPLSRSVRVILFAQAAGQLVGLHPPYGPLRSLWRVSPKAVWKASLFFP